MSILTLIIFSFVFFLIGGAVIFFFLHLKYSKKENSAIEMRSELQSFQNLNEELNKQLISKENDIKTLRNSLETTQQAKTIAETKLETANKNIEEQKELLNKAESKLSTTFEALSGKALKDNNEAFLKLAKESLQAVLNDAKGNIGQKEEAIKGLVQPLQSALDRYEKQIKDLENKRDTAYGSLTQQLSSLLASETKLQKETANLISALRKPEIKGNWGQMTLKRVVELSGMSEYCDFTEQVSVDTDEGRLIPDMVVHLPADREIIIDSKVATNSYLDAIDAESEDQKNSLLLKHSQQVRKHMKELSSKSYWSQFQKSPDFVVMFLPGESFLIAALSQDPSLIEDSMGSKVFLATPMTLIALLRVIAYGWRQEQITKSALEIALLGKELYDRFRPFLEHINNTGESLEQSVNHFNRMVSSLEQRVLVSVRKFKELGISVDKELPDMKSIEQVPIKKNSSDE